MENYFPAPSPKIRILAAYGAQCNVRITEFMFFTSPAKSQFRAKKRLLPLGQSCSYCDARPGGILSLSNMNKVMNPVDPLPLPSVAGKVGP